MGCHFLLMAITGLFAFDIAGLPLLFKYTKFLRRKLVFTNFWNIPMSINFEKPTRIGIKGAKNFCIDFLSKVDDCYVKLGAWYICPQTQLFSENLDYTRASIKERIMCDLKITARPIVLYCHGNSNHRGSSARIQTYKMFQQLNFHTITFDYRGYGNSTNIQPTEQGVVEDTLQMYSFIVDILKNVSDCLKPPVILWGHSLGTAIAANLVCNINDICHNMLDKTKCLPNPDALVLEAPFNNLLDQMNKHPYSKLVNWLPYYNSAFVQPVATSSEFSFKTDEYLLKTPQVPILILHSVKDEFIPYYLAAKLHKAIKDSRKRSGGAPLVFHTFEKRCKIGHNNISQASETKEVVTDFLDIVEERKAAIDKIIEEKQPKPKKLGANTKEKLIQSDQLQRSDVDIQNDDDASKDPYEIKRQLKEELERIKAECIDDIPCFNKCKSVNEVKQKTLSRSASRKTKKKSSPLKVEKKSSLRKKSSKEKPGRHQKGKKVSHSDIITDVPHPRLPGHRRTAKYYSAQNDSESRRSVLNFLHIPRRQTYKAYSDV